jgi:SWI/SNF related-matrix-associated actin-dependent regulator of chromatin subfamily C
VPVITANYILVFCASKDCKLYIFSFMQLQKTEAKMSLFADVEHVALRTREYTEKTRKKLLMERNAIIAARMGALPSRPNQQGAAGNRLPPGYGAPAVRPPNAMPRPSS